MAAALVVSLTTRLFFDESTPKGFAMNLIITTIATTIVWLTATFLTSPEPRETLRAFYTKVRPAGGGWAPIASETGLEPPRGEMGRNTIAWILGIALVYSIMFGTGALIFGQARNLGLFSVIAAASFVGLIVVYRRESANVA